MTNAPTVAASVAVTVLPDSALPELSAEELRQYFAPCLDALDLNKPIEHFDRGEFTPATARQEGKVYFVGGAGGAIKIGFTVRSVEERLREYQAGSPVPLTVLAVREARQAVEFSYHRRFKAHRLHGEWFSPHPDILAEIARLSPNPTKEI